MAPGEGRLAPLGLYRLGLGDEAVAECVPFAPDFALEFAQSGTAVGVAEALFQERLALDPRAINA